MTTTEPRALRDYQIEATDAVLREWGSGRNRTAVVLPTGAGKPLHDDTPIPTVGGFVRMGDIRTGHYVIGADGKPTRVVAVQPQGVIDLYRVEFDDGAELLAGPHHLWTVQRKGRKSRTVTTEWLRGQPMMDGDGYCWRVPVADPAQFVSRGLPADPYLVGSLIANGGMGGVPILVTPDMAVVDEIARRGIDVKPAYSAPGACPRWTFPGLSHALERSGIRGVLSAGKSIPELFKVADESSRWDLLRGLMDGDGSTRSGGRRSVNYHTVSRVLADDVAELAWSLGVRASVSQVDRGHAGKGIEYTVHMLPPVGVSLFTSRRRDREESPHRHFAPRRSIVSIEYAGTGPASCITVAADDGLFAAGRRYVVTHNSTVIANIAATAYRDYGLSVALLAHRAELLDQMAGTVSAVDPTLPPAGIVRADQDESDAPIVVASLQTLTNPRRLEALGQRRVILWDEVHHAGATSWEQVLRDLGGYRDDHFFCGFTATLRRDDGKALRSVIQTVAFERTLRWAIEHNPPYLVKPRGLTVRIPTLDLGKVKVTAGDFQNNDLAEQMEAAQPYIVQAIVQHAHDRRAIVFAASVDAAHGLSAALRAVGITASAVTGDMGYTARQEVYDAYRSGRTQMLVTVMVLTEGADFPMCDAAIIARPTRSQNLYSQMVGRALRLWPGKTDALVMDLVGASRVLKLVTLSDLDAGTETRRIEVDGTEIEPEDDEDVAGASAPAPRARREGPVDMVSVDLLSEASTAILWLQTRKGVPFLAPTGAGVYVFLWPDGNGMWRVGAKVHSPRQLAAYQAKHAEQYGTEAPQFTQGWQDDGRAWSLDVAVSLAEDTVEAAGLVLPRREASWRRSQAPSESQLQLARSVGITGAELMTKARVSDEITVKLASDSLDPR